MANAVALNHRGMDGEELTQQRRIRYMGVSRERPPIEVRLDVPYGGGPAGTQCNDLYLPAVPGTKYS